MKQGRKRDPRSEASQRAALRRIKQGSAFRQLGDGEERHIVRVYETNAPGALLAIFDLRDCYRKRAPLKGIKKKLGEIVRGKI